MVRRGPCRLCLGGCGSAARTIDVLHLEATQFSPAHASRIKRDQHGAMEQIAGGVDEPNHFFSGEDDRETSRRLGIGHFFNRVCPLQGFAEEESQRCRTMADGADTKLPFVEQVHLIGADLFRAKLIRRTAEMFCERLYNFQVAVHGSLRVITTLELFQHLFTKLGHGDLLVTHKISRSEVEMLDRPTRVASAARAASFKRRSVDRGSANSQIVAYAEGELRSNPGGARERYFVLSVADASAAGEVPYSEARESLAARST